MGTVRRCVGCRRSDSPENLVRVVSEAGRASVGMAQPLPGRGAYVHRNPECVERSLISGVWARALREPALDTSGLAQALSGVIDKNRLNG